MRQYPAHFGSTAIAEIEQDTEAESLTREICRRLNLVGYVSIEFKRDSATGQLMIVEITPGRVNRQIGITDLAGRSVVVAWYRSLAGLPPETDLPLRTGVRWASLANDLRALPAYRKEKEWPLGRWLHSYLRVRRTDFSFSDPMPLVASMGICATFLWRQPLQYLKAFDVKRTVDDTVEDIGRM
jgi:predicted ATP-grasp superfamily ATP-dependent carboligase